MWNVGSMWAWSIGAHRVLCTGGRPGPVLVCPPPPPRVVLRDSGVGAMAPTAPKFFCACFPFIKLSMF